MTESKHMSPADSERTVKLAAHLYAGQSQGNFGVNVEHFLSTIDPHKHNTWHFKWVATAHTSLRALQQIDAEEQPNRMPLKQFARIGYLQEVNRRFLHPLGLALALGQDNDTGAVRFLGIEDHSDDPEGIIFKSFSESDVERGKMIDTLYKQGLLERQKELGYGVQPLSSDQDGQVIDSDKSIGAE